MIISRTPFRLSLFGFDPDGDHYRLTRELNGRRINLALVHDSLLLEKGAGRVPHSGGKRFEENSELYQDRKSTRLNSSHSQQSRMPSSA